MTPDKTEQFLILSSGIPICAKIPRSEPSFAQDFQPKGCISQGARDKDMVTGLSTFAIDDLVRWTVTNDDTIDDEFGGCCEVPSDEKNILGLCQL